MKTSIIIAALMPLAGCNALGGIPQTALDSMANAGASCVRASGVWGNGVITMANTDKGVIRYGGVKVNPETCAIEITNDTRPAAKPAP